MAKKSDKLDDDYEYHKQNDYPGERVAERERVADREEAANKKSDARVAAKGRYDDRKSDARAAEKGRQNDRIRNSEMRRSNDKAARIHRKRNNTDAIGLAIIYGLIVILLVGSVFAFVNMKEQSDDIDAQAREIVALKSQIADGDVFQFDTVRLSDDAKQVQLYKDFVVMTNNVEDEVAALEDYDVIYSDMYQLCSGFAERDNNINHALYRFAEKEIVYYKQIAVLADKPECNDEIETMRSAMEESKIADEELYVQTKNLCNEITDNVITDDTKSRTGWNEALDNAEQKAASFDDAEEAVIGCFA
ncbi:MAG: hypothetical protein ACQESE_02730 [Nanobdellota archaeon]